MRENMMQHLARLKIGPVAGFDGRMLRRNDGAYLLPGAAPDGDTDSPLVEPWPVTGKCENVGGGG
jgi:hypothetical protein